jgi:pSer/pThr/pTyr-binding forkhead associated (FHA) protein
MDDAFPTPAATVAFQPLRLRLHPGGHALDLTSPDMVLGRHSDADLRLPLPDVSRRHCRFVFSDAGWELVDLGSLNGVYVNGARVGRTLLYPGDQIRIGGLEFDVEALDDSPAAEMLRRIVEALPAAPAGDEPQHTIAATQFDAPPLPRRRAS